MFDASHPFYRPLWRRVAIVAFTASWALVEYRNGAPIWALLFAVISAWCAWFFFVVYEDTKPGGDGKEHQSTPSDEGD